MSTEKTAEARNDEIIDLAEIDSEYVELIELILTATPEELEKINKLIEER